MEAKGATGKGTKDEPQMLCNNKDMPIQEKIDDVIEGWEGKAKGMFQHFGRGVSLIRTSQTQRITH
jgi:hypothetical protein